MNDASPPSPMPALFISHGSPMHAVTEDDLSRSLQSLAAGMPLPKAILAISAHWYGPGVFVTAQNQPRTIYDFSGFPPELYTVRYPAPGSPVLAERVRSLLGRDRVAADTSWGLDHGTWTVLRWMYPEADVPVIQLSLDSSLSSSAHWKLAGSLAPLRDEGVLVLGSGNLSHNLRDTMQRLRRGDTTSIPEYSRRFDDTVKAVLMAKDRDALVKLVPDSEDGVLNHPTPDHWLPLLYAAAVATPEDAIRFPYEGFEYGLSMRSVSFG